MIREGGTLISGPEKMRTAPPPNALRAGSRAPG